jgi:hypothetical protein
MSDQEKSTVSSRPNARTLTRLLTEYTAKWNALRDRAHVLHKEAVARMPEDDLHRILSDDYNNLRPAIQKLTPPSRSLAQHVSQLIEHSGMDILATLELRLRLAEFEQAIQETSSFLAHFPALAK